MKTNFKRISKRSLALLLGILMLFSTIFVGTIFTANAWTHDVTLHIQTSAGSNNWAEHDLSNGTCSVPFGDDQVEQELQFEIGIKAGDQKYTATSPVTYDKTVSNQSFQKDGYITTKIKITKAGTYVFSYDKTTNKFGVTYPDGSSGGGETGTTYTLKNGDSSLGDFTFVSGNDYTLKANLIAKTTYSLYVTNGNISYYNNSHEFDANKSVKLYGYTSNTDFISFTPTLTGEYTFKWNNANVNDADDYGTLSYTAPTETPTVAPTTPATTTDYYLVESSDWNAFKSMTKSKDGLYSYYENKNDSLEFKITDATKWDSNQYDINNVNHDNFNGADVDLVRTTDISDQGKNNIVCNTNPCYILVYHPKTTLNTTEKPIICAATKLPQGKQYSITTTCDTHSRTDAPASAAEGEKVEFSPKFDAGYELKSITVTGAEYTVDSKTGMYSFTMPAKDVTITVTSKEVTGNNQYYIRGSFTEWDHAWTTSKAMKPSADGNYEYYEVTDGAAHGFVIDNSDNFNNEGNVIHDKTYITSKYNGTDVVVSPGEGTDPNSYVAKQSGKYYIIIYYPNTEINKTDKPKICAATTLPEGAQQIVQVHAKDGTILKDDKGNIISTKYATMGDTEITQSADVTDIQFDSGNLCHHANARVGKPITITTTISGTYKYNDKDENYADNYLVKGWVVNGYSVGIRDTDTVTENGVYTTTFTIDPMWIDDHNVLEITPVYYYAVKDTNKDAFFTFYVEDFDDEMKETWGNTIACYPYYYNGGADNAADQLLGEYPGQPMLKDAGDRYFVQVPKYSKNNFASKSGNVISGITLNNYVSKTKHGDIFEITENLQTYDYDDFKSIIRSYPEVSNIVLSLKYDGDYNNIPNENGYSSEADIKEAGKHNNEYKWQFNVNYNGDKYINVFGGELSSVKDNPNPTNYLRAISNGYDDTSKYVGQFATCWYIYAPATDGKWNLVAKLPPSALAYKDVTTLTEGLEADGVANKADIINAYNALQSYTNYPVQIVYEGNYNNNDTNAPKRCAGKWYYTVKGQEVIGDIEIQYENSDPALRGTYETDTFTGAGVGTVTGADAHFTNEEAQPHQFKTTLDNEQKYTMTAEQSSGQYKFVGWYVLEGDDTEPVFLTKEIDASATRNKSLTFIARYDYVDEVAKVEITYNFKDFTRAEGEGIAYTTDHDKSVDTPNSYSKSDSIIVPNVNNDAEIAKIVRKNAPIIHSDYYDYALNEASIKYSYNANADTKTVYVTATMDDTPHLYTVTVNGKPFTGYYQNNIELFADEFDITYTEGATALWYLVDGDKKTLYYDDFGLNYRFIVDNAQLEVVANDNNESLDGKSAIYNSNYELGYKDGKQKITQNFYITDYLDNAYDNGKVVEGATNVTYVGGGILYYSSDEDGTALNATAAAALADKEAIINEAIKNTNGTYNKVGYMYSTYDPAKFRYSEFLIAYQHIMGITLNNTDDNAGRHISAYSFFVYTYKVGETSYTQIQISDTMAVATAYEPK